MQTQQTFRTANVCCRRAEDALTSSETDQPTAELGRLRPNNSNSVCQMRISRGHLVTSLLFLEKDEQVAIPRGRVMAMMDLILEIIAAAFESPCIVIDDPMVRLVPYYNRYGYVDETWVDHRRLLAKTVEVG